MNIFGFKTKMQDKDTSSKFHKGSQPPSNITPKVKKNQLIVEELNDSSTEHKDTDISMINGTSNEVVVVETHNVSVPAEAPMDVSNMKQANNKHLEENRKAEAEQVSYASHKASNNAVPKLKVHKQLETKVPKQIEHLPTPPKDNSNTPSATNDQTVSEQENTNSDASHKPSNNALPILPEDSQLTTETNKNLDIITNLTEESRVEQLELHEQLETNVPKQIEHLSTPPKDNSNSPFATNNQTVSEQENTNSDASHKASKIADPISSEDSQLTTKPNKNLDNITNLKKESRAEQLKEHEQLKANVPKQIEHLPPYPRDNPNTTSVTNDQTVSEQENTKPIETLLTEKKIVSNLVQTYKEVPHKRSSRISQSSFSSCGPSSSSMCHLTELSQPKPDALKLTLIRLRHLHGNETEKVSNIKRHLHGLRNGPRNKSNKTYENNVNGKRKSNANQPQPIRSTSDDDEASLGDRQAFHKFASHLFSVLENNRALENYEASKLMMPVEIDYYCIAYTALVEAFGQPYHKCTLELYQQLAAEVGLQAEMFVMDKTPKVTSVVA